MNFELYQWHLSFLDFKQIFHFVLLAKKAKEVSKECSIVMVKQVDSLARDVGEHFGTENSIDVRLHVICPQVVRPKFHKLEKRLLALFSSQGPKILLDELVQSLKGLIFPPRQFFAHLVISLV